MELRHLDTLVAIDEEGTFTAAADSLRTVQSNVSDQVRQLEAELGVTLLARGRGGATATESGRVVLARARRIRRELELLHEELAALQGLQVGQRHVRRRRHREPVARAPARGAPRAAARRACGCSSTRARPSVCSPSCVTGELAPGGRHRAGATTRASSFEHLADEPMVGLAPPGDRHRRGPVLGRPTSRATASCCRPG